MSEYSYGTFNLCFAVIPNTDQQEYKTYFFTINKMGNILTFNASGGGTDLSVITADAYDILEGKVSIDKNGNILEGQIRKIEGGTYTSPSPFEQPIYAAYPGYYLTDHIIINPVPSCKIISGSVTSSSSMRSFESIECFPYNDNTKTELYYIDIQLPTWTSNDGGSYPYIPVAVTAMLKGYGSFPANEFIFTDCPGDGRGNEYPFYSIRNICYDGGSGDSISSITKFTDYKFYANPGDCLLGNGHVLVPVHEKETMYQYIIVLSNSTIYHFENA